MGFRGWGLPALEAACDSHDVGAIVTHPEDIEPYNVAFAESIQEFGAKRGIPTFVSRNAHEDQIRTAVKDCKPDIILSSNWRRRIDPDFLRMARFGGLNVHRSLLPKYAGFAPVNWAVDRGESVTGVTLHSMADGIDAGDIVGQESVEITGDDTATTVFHKMTPIVWRLVKRTLDEIESGTTTRIAQDPNRIEYFPKRTERDLRINWEHGRTRVLNLIRAQSDPFPPAITSWNGKKICIRRAVLADRCFRGTPGRIVEISPSGIIVLCGEGDGHGGQGLLLTSVSSDGFDPVNPNQIIRATTEYFG
jgi:methionyl-tRNA formyltransferase